MTVANDIYDRIWTLLQDASLDYFETKQKAFFPRMANLTSPAQYPWIFIEFIGETPIEIFQLPRNWKRNITFAVVALTISSTATDIDDLIYSDNANVKGILDMKDDLKALFWGATKVKHFSVSGVRDWTIGRVGIPSIPMIQRLLQSEYVRGIQMDLVFKITEQDTM